MANDPYAALGSPVGENTGKTAPAPQAATAPQPAAPADPYAQVGSDADTPAQKVSAGYETVGGFDNELPAHAHPLPSELEHKLLDILANDPVDTAASHARQVAAEHGISPFASTDPKFADSFDQTIAYRKKYHTISDSIINRLAKPNTQDQVLQGSAADTARATVRGAASFLPVNTVDSALHAVADTVTGKAPDGIAADFNRWADTNYGEQVNDEENHPAARLVGQLIGGLAIPTGYEGVALSAGKSVLKSGGSMVEARAAAAAAARTRLAKEGAAVGSVHGFDSAAPGQGVVGGVEGGVTGGVGGYGLAKVGQAAAPIAKTVLNSASIAAKDIPQSYVQLARDLNIKRTPATNSKTGVSTVIQAGLAALPGGSPVAKAAERETADLANAAKGVADSVGTVSDRQGAGEAVAQGAQTYKSASGLTGKGMYQQRDALIGGSDTPVPTDNAAAAITDMATRFPTSPAVAQLREHPVIRAIEGALPGEGKQPLTLGEVTEALSHVRGVQRNLEAQSNTTSPVLARVKQLEQGLEDDVMAAAKRADQQAGRVPGSEGSAVAAQQDADKFWADRASALNGSLKKPIQSAKDDTKVSGEQVYSQVAGDMDAKSGNLARLRDTWFRLPGEAKSTFAATKIDDLGRATPGQQNDANSAWSFQTFLTNVSKLSPQARNIVFGAKADGEIQKIAAYADRLRQLDKSRNFSNTAKNYFAGAFLATVGTAVLHGDLSAAGEAAMAIPATWGGAKLLLSTPAMRDWTASAMKAAMSGNETAMKVLSKRLGAIAASEPTIANDVLGLQRAIGQAANDNLRSLAASTGSKQPKSEKDKARGPR